MVLKDVSLIRQVDVALEQLEGELRGMSAGTIVLQIRENSVGKFGIRHLPMDCGEHTVSSKDGMTREQVSQLRRMAIEALKQKSGWTFGEIAYDFMLRQGKLFVTVLFESNYNMANHLIRFSPKRRDQRGVAGE